VAAILKMLRKVEICDFKNKNGDKMSIGM